MYLDHLAHKGYVVARRVAPEPLIAAAKQAIADWLGVDLSRPETWYPRDPLEWSIVPVHHAQALWDLRQHPEVHAVFSEVRGTEKLWVSMDRAIYKVPISEAHPEHRDESQIHWDLDPRTLAWPSYQGMLFLTDTTGGQGPFECVPTLFQQLESWLAAHPDLDLEAPLDLQGHEVVQVPVQAGDLVVWDSRLPHHGGPNRGLAPRLSVPIAMWPEGSEEERAQRVAWWRERRPPPWWRGCKGQVDPEPGEPAELTALGRKLCGLERW